MFFFQLGGNIVGGPWREGCFAHEISEEDKGRALEDNFENNGRSDIDIDVIFFM